MNSSPPPRLRVLRAENLLRAGFPHGFATRIGGVSEGPFASLNFGAGDSSEKVATNVARFALEVGFDPRALRQVTQVHGARVVDAATLASAEAREEADALVLGGARDRRAETPSPVPFLASEEGESHGRRDPSIGTAGAHGSPPRLRGGVGGGVARAVGVRVADCVPVLVGSRASGAVAAIHAGWRGVVAGVVAAGLHGLGGDRVAAIGPCIGACCFEVGAEVALPIAAACGDGAVVRRYELEAGKARVDLRRAVRAQLASFGVTDVEDVPGCTRCEPERFFSYRRDGERSGRHLAAIALRD